MNGKLVCAIAFALILVQAPSVPAAGRDEAAADPEIAGPAPVEPGRWRSKVQQKFDPQTRTLSRQLYTIGTPNPRAIAILPGRPIARRPTSPAGSTAAGF